MPPSEPPATLTGVVERIIFLNEENHYTIAEFRPEIADARARAEPVTILGALPGVECGETLHLSGEWTRHERHGPQFRIASFRSELPASVYGIRKYLGSGLVSGIGKVYANKIVDAFGTDTFRVLSEESGRLRDVPGIGRKRAAAIKDAWEEKRAERELYIFLQTYGVTPAQCVKLVRHFGPEAGTVLKNNPYRAAREIEGIGFRTADRIAINLGFANDAPPRLDAGLIFALETLQEEGHTAFPQGDLVEHASNLLETFSEKILARIEALAASRQIVRHEGGARLIQLPRNDFSERRIAAAVARLSQARSALPPINVTAAAQWAEKKAGLRFHERQREAVVTALENKFSILTGGPGSGKTTTLRALVEILAAKKARVHLAAPTGRAAQRLSETTGGQASTLHRLLKYDPAGGMFTCNEDDPLETDFLMVDEASMLDSWLAAALFSAIPPGAHLLLVGDVDQLPSVGAGNVLKDLIATGRAPVARLSYVYRQDEHSGIVSTAHAVNTGDSSLHTVASDILEIPASDDFVFISAVSPEDCLAKVIALCSSYIPRHCREIDAKDDVQVLAPMHKGVAGVANLNLQLQAALNPNRGPGLKAAGSEFRPGDKIIQLRNNYDKNLFNGDIGSVTSVNSAAGTLIADFDGDEHSFTRGECSDLALAYAISLHKSQGSEYPAVIIVLLKQHYMMLQRNLIYTGITRGRRKVFLVGDPAAYDMAVRNNESKARITHLREKIAALPEPS